MGATRTAAGLCAIVLGALGIHKFLLGYMAEGAIMAAVTVAGLLWTWTNMPGAAMAIIGIIEGIMYLTKTDAEFTNTYIVHRRGWF
ncbi:MAG: TM2 domain-containing protein [Chloroflexi bacterium]|nr:TM2 domain-containing protein [Chloroflexota bacterium]